jgi:hypothetical protein
MGANAVTSIPDFVALQILTADELDVVNCGIPVFADSSARDAAFGGSGEKTLAEGQYAYLESTKQTLVYDGSTWVSVGVNPGFVCVKAETAFTSVASVTADNVFTSGFTNYRIIVTGTNSVATNLRYKLRVGGVSSSANYNTRYQYSDPAGVSTGQDGVTTAGLIGGEWNPELDALSADFYGPFVAAPTSFFSTNTVSRSSYGTPVMYISGGNHNSATAYDGIELFPSTGTMTGSYTIYGYSKTV